MGNMKKSKAGRPRIELDEKQILELTNIQCTTKEIAAVMGCSEDTLERNYAGILEAGREYGKSSLRRAQWKLAMSGNAQMLIWLGRMVLQQREEINLTSNEADVRKLLESWEVTAKKKTFSDRARENKVIAIGE